MPSNLFLISIFTVNILIIIFCVIDFFFKFYLLTFDLLGNEFRSFFICQGFDLMTCVTSLKSLCGSGFFFLTFFYDFIILHYLKNNNFVVIFNFFSIDLSWFHGLYHGFYKLFFNRGFFIFCLYLIFEDFFYNEIFYKIIFILK
jgi:hypothetical protein